MSTTNKPKTLEFKAEDLQPVELELTPEQLSAVAGGSKSTPSKTLINNGGGHWSQDSDAHFGDW